MNHDQPPSSSQYPNDKLGKKEIIDCLWRDYELRQKHYWTSFNRYGVAIIFILIAPYIKPENIKLLGMWVVIFPVVGLLLSLLSTWLLGAEYQRLRAVKEKYDSIFYKGTCEIRYPNDTVFHKLFAKRIGDVTVLIFGAALVILSAVDGLLLSIIKIPDIAK